MTDTATETAPAPAPTVRPIVVDILAAHEDWAYLLHPELPVRPARPAEMEAMEASARAEFQAAMASKAAVGTIPHGPWPHTKAAARAAEPAPEPAAVTVTDQPAADPGPIHCDCQDDPVPVLNPIAELALSRFEAAFAEDPKGEGDRARPDTTAQIAAVGDDTQVIEGDAK